MEPISQTPTAPVDYAAISAIYASLLGATAATVGRRQAIPAPELVPLGAATFALSKLVVHEKVETWLRVPFVEESANGRRPRGDRLRFAVGELLSCTRCMGAWAALGLVGLRLASPSVGRTVTTVLAASAGSDFLHTTFSWLTARANAEQHQAEVATGAARTAQAG